MIRTHKPVTELNVGDVVEYHGAQFEIIKQGHTTLFSYENGPEVGPGEVAVPVGKWVGGRVIEGYFGPDKDWTFQGNRRNIVSILAVA